MPALRHFTTGEYNAEQLSGACCALCGQRFTGPDDAEMPDPPIAPAVDPKQVMRVCRDRIKCVIHRHGMSET